MMASGSRTSFFGDLTMNESKFPVHSDPEIMSGMPVFQGTRVPFQTLLDYLKGGESIDDFLYDFPSVAREQAIEAIQQAGQILVAHACPA
jgi:uncharacterized protein (DUF433 family)